MFRVTDLIRTTKKVAERILQVNALKQKMELYRKLQLVTVKAEAGKANA